MRKRRRRDTRPLVDHLDDRCLLSGTAGYTPAQITAAYGLNAITFQSSTGTTVKGDGTGETIALIEMYHDPNLASDLATFDQEYGLPAPTLTVDNLAGSQTDSGWALEESLDVEWAHAIAPGANILVVEAAPATTDTQSIQNLIDRREHGQRDAGRRGRLDELGGQRVLRRDRLRFGLHDRGNHLHRVQRRQPRRELPGSIAAMFFRSAGRR